MRILHVLDHSIPLHSGYTFRTRAILDQQRALGWETFHITSGKHAEATGSTVLEEVIEGFGFYRTRRSAGVLKRLPVINQLSIVKNLQKRISEVVMDVKPDIIHAHSPVLNALAALKVGKAFKIPVVYEVRAFWEDAAVDHGTSVEGGLRYKLTHALETYALKKADAVTTICEGLRNDIITRGIDKEKITVIPNAVDIEKFTIQNSSDRVLVSRLGLEGKNVLGFIGSFYAYEGLPLLLESLTMILEDEPETHLVLVGGGPQEKELKKLVAKLGLEEKVVFTGRVPHNEIQSYYSLIDVFVYPRISMRLTELVTPLKPLEAMAQGKIVVASDVGGHRELIRPGENGELFPAGDVAELAKTVVELFRQREDWGKRQAESRQFVEQERTWKKSVALYGGTYARLTGILSE